MSGRLDGRVSRLENGCRVPCEECGFDGDWSKVEIVVEWYDGEGEDTGPEQPVYCERCGEPTELVVAWEDIPGWDDLPPRPAISAEEGL
jgi:hypothetical protein